MTLLLRDTSAKTDAAAPVEAPPEVRTCPTCHAPLEDGQDWCLNCGEAQPSRRLALPGKRAAATVLALTTVLVGGAVAASYAALQDGSAPASTPMQLAQVPAPSTAAPAPAPDPAAVAPSSSVPVTPSSTEPTDTSIIPPDSGSTPVTPSSSSSSSSSSSQGTSSSSQTATDTGTSTGTSTTKGDDGTADTRTSTTPAETEPVAIKLGDDAAALYDPYKRDTAAGDPKKAFDADPNTSFPVTVAAGSTQIGAGLTVDLPKLEGIREIDLTTRTPGFKIEIYATDDTDVPPDVLDTRWAHLKDVTGVGSDADGGKEIVSLGSGTTKYRHVLLWFTAPPTTGSTVRVSELKLLG